MKKLFFIIGLFFSLSAMAQPTNYTKINMRYRWLSGMFDSALYVPRYNGTPSGVRVNETSVYDGMIAMDTTNNRLYIYSGGSWIRLAAYSEVAAYTAGNGLTLSGSQFKLGSPLTENTTIDATGYDFNLPGIPTVSSTTGRKVALIDTTTGKVERIDPATLVTNIYNSDGTLSGNRTISGNGSTLDINSLSDLSLDGFGGMSSTFLGIELNSGTSFGLGTSSNFFIKDSIKVSPFLGTLNIDSLRTWSGISDTTHKKPMTWDTRNGRWEYAANWPQQKISLVFGAGSGADSDTTAFTTSAIYGSFYNDADTIVVTSMRSVLQGTSPDVTYKVWYNDSLNVEAGATALVTAGSQVTNTTTGTNVTSFDVTKIPPGVWVWVKTSTVATKPKYFSLTVNGYRK